MKTLDAHARAYVEGIDGASRLREYQELLRRVGSALIENAESRSFLSNPHSEDHLRNMAENTGRIVSRRHEMTPEQYEAEVRAEMESCRSQLMPEATKWNEWYRQILARIEMRFEARYRFWQAEAIERARKASGSETAEAQRPGAGGESARRP